MILFQIAPHSEVLGKCEFGGDTTQPSTATDLSVLTPVRTPDHHSCMRASGRDEHNDSNEFFFWLPKLQNHEQMNCCYFSLSH